MKHEPAPRSTSTDVAQPTTVQHHEDDQTLLARWLQKGMEKGASFWLLLLGFVAVVLAVGYLVSGYLGRPSPASEGWREMILASSEEDFQRLATTQENTPVGRWAALQSASAKYRAAIFRLPADRTTADPMLTQAVEEFRVVEEGAPAGSMLRRLAMLGVARTLETQGELADAITEYRAIAEAWPDTDDGKDSAKRALALKEPEVAAFYKKFETFKPSSPSTTIGPRGTNLLDLPPGHPPLDGGIMPAPSILGGVKPGAVEDGELPADVFQKSKAERKAEGSDAKGESSLPDVFPDEKPNTPFSPK